MTPLAFDQIDREGGGVNQFSWRLSNKHHPVQGHGKPMNVFGNPTDTSDIRGAQAGSYKAFRSLRKTNPLNPDYRTMNDTDS